MSKPSTGKQGCVSNMTQNNEYKMSTSESGEAQPPLLCSGFHSDCGEDAVSLVGVRSTPLCGDCVEEYQNYLVAIGWTSGPKITPKPEEKR